MEPLENPRPVARFQAGDKIRVKPGVTVPDFEDIPLGGWTGTITGIEQDEVEDGVTYEIEWDQKTIKGMHRVYKNRCERDGYDVETMWLDDEDIEPDDGRPVPMEQPTQIKTRPLNMKDEEDRIRDVFGLTHDDPLPDVSQKTLRVYHDYLATRLKFPFAAFHGIEDTGPFSSRRVTITVTGLIAPEEEADEDDGLLCTARYQGEGIEVALRSLELKKKDPNLRLISDYSLWFEESPWQDGLDDEDEEDEEDEEPAEGHVEASKTTREIEGERAAPPGWTPKGVLLRLVALVIVGGAAGAAIGAALPTIPSARTAALVCGIPGALFGATVGAVIGYIIGEENRMRYGTLTGALLGILAGAVLGTIAGFLYAAFPWSPGGLALGIIVRAGRMRRNEEEGTWLLYPLLGILGGTILAAYRHDPGHALTGGAVGAIIGIIVLPGFLFAILGFVSVIEVVSEQKAGQAPQHG